MCLCKEMQNEKVHQTTITQISKSSVQHFSSSWIKAVILHTSTLQKECKYILTSFSSYKALICAEAGQSSRNHKIFRILLSSLCDAWPSRQMFLHVSTVLPRDRMIHFHTVLSWLPIILTPEGAANIYAFLSVTPLCWEGFLAVISLTGWSTGGLRQHEVANFECPLCGKEKAAFQYLF